MKIIVWAVLMSLISAPLWAGSLEITVTDQSGRTTTTRKVYSEEGSRLKGPEGQPAPGPAGAQGGRPGAIQSPARMSPESAQNKRAKEMFQLTDKMIKEMDKSMDSAVEEFKKDAEKVQ